MYSLKELFPLLTSGEHVHSPESQGLLIKRNTYLLVYNELVPTPVPLTSWAHKRAQARFSSPNLAEW